MKNNKDKETPHYMKQWHLFYRGNTLLLEKLHQLGAELQTSRLPYKLPSVEALQERIKLLEKQLEQSAG